MRRFNLVLVSLFAALALLSCSDDTSAPTADTSAATPDLAAPDKAAPSADKLPADQAAAKLDTRPNFDAVAKCPMEVNLTTKVPCMCGTTLVYDVKVQYPECVAPKIVKCCPAVGAPKCE